MAAMDKVNKKAKVWLWAGVTLVLCVAIVPLAIWVTHTQTAQTANGEARCDTQAETRAAHVYHVVMQDEKATPQHTLAKLCDKLVITNLDPKERLVAFGPHEHHVSYDGVSERILAQGQSLTITLIQPGTFYFHDHTDDIVNGTFTVANTPLSAAPLN